MPKNDRGRCAEQHTGRERYYANAINCIWLPYR